MNKFDEVLPEHEELETTPDLDVLALHVLLPHRYPFLMIDRLSQIQLGKSAVGLKNVTINEGFFQGHFPGNPVMPGVLIIEALAQTAGALVMHTLKMRGEDIKNAVVYFMSIEQGRFRRRVFPGDSLKLHVQRLHNRHGIWKFKGEAKVDGALVADATYTAMITQGTVG